ncbi:CAP domain-containing protein [Thermaerobacter litoralis]
MSKRILLRRAAGMAAAALLVVSVAATPAQASWYLVQRAPSTPAPAPSGARPMPEPAPVTAAPATAPASARQPVRGSSAAGTGLYYAWKLAILRQRSGLTSQPTAPTAPTPTPTPNPGGSAAPTRPGTATPVPVPGPASGPSSSGGAGSGTPAAAPAPSPAPAPAGTTLTAAERHLVDLVNQARRQHGLPPLSVDPDLVRLARLKAEDLKANGYFAHESPTYGTPYAMERQAGIAARVMGAENLAKSRDVDRAHMQLMASEGHRANILNPDHDAIGVAVVPIPYGVLVVQLFLGDRYR